MFDIAMKLKQYDSSLDSHVTMYDHLPYERNYDFCNENHIGLVSGNLAKYYMIAPTDKVTTISNHDDDIEARLQEIAAQAIPVQTSVVEESDIPSSPDGITSEQMEHLLSDQPEENTEEDSETSTEDSGVIDFANLNF